MCGIAGILAHSREALAPIEAMTVALAHRGPDMGAVWTDAVKPASLGHRRLSVIDLSSAASQPMHLQQSGFVIVFNGEIYNFRDLRKELLNADPAIQFITQSDTETILHAYRVWGTDLPTKLDGMFALAIYEQASGQIFLCRDRLGKKPIYYFADDHHFIFASEIKSLMRHPRVSSHVRPDHHALREFLHMGFVLSARTGWESIHRFPAGSWALITTGQPVKPMTYWTAKQERVHQELKYTDAQDQLGHLIENAVAKRLISDVPLGTFLSGGTDSSLVTAIAHKIRGGSLQTFNIGFEESSFDESTYAREVASHLGTSHQSYILKERDATKMLEECMAHFDEPFADASAIPTMLVSKMARQEVTVALTGDGGDELFMGYGAYDWANRLNTGWARWGGIVISPMLKSLGTSRWKRIGELIDTTGVSSLRSHIFSQEHYLFSEREIADDLLVDPKALGLHSFADLPGYGPAESQALFDLENYLRDDLLAKVDRASMYHSLECRCPLLDKDVVSFALKLPSHLRARKRLLKGLLRRYLPSHLIDRPKWGFSIPLAKWLQGDLKYLMEDYLNQRIVAELGFFHVQKVEQLKSRFAAGDTFLYNRLWLMILTQKWLKAYGRQ